MNAPLLPDAWRALSASEVPEEAIPEALGVLGRLQGELLARLVARSNADPPPAAPAENGRLLTVQEAASLLGVTPDWLYRHADRLPFTKRLSRKALRFSEGGLRRWIAARRG